MSESTAPVQEPVQGDGALPADTEVAAVPVAPVRPVERARARTGLESMAIAALVLILAVGAWFRFVGLNWDDTQHIHPDERFLTGVYAAIKPVSSLSEYFNTARSTLNPENSGNTFFVYGDLPVITVRYAAELLNRTCSLWQPGAQDCVNQWYTGYDRVYLVGRAISGLADLLSVLVLFFIARKLYDTRVALLASALMALAVMLIQQAHFATVDSYANLWVVVAFLFAVRASERNRLRDYALFGLTFGMAVASKINSAPMALVIILAAVVFVSRALEALADDPDREIVIRSGLVTIMTRASTAIVVAAISGLVLSGLIFLISFRVFQPYAFGGSMPCAQVGDDKLYQTLCQVGFNANWLRSMDEVHNQLIGNFDAPFARQWVNRPPYLFAFYNMVLWGMGLPLGLIAWIGWLAAGVDSLRGNWRKHLLPFGWVGAYFLYEGGQFVPSIRYMLPIYPFLILLGAWALVSLWDFAAKRSLGHLVGDRRVPRRSSLLKGAAVALLAVVLVGTFAWAFAFVQIYMRPTSRVAATRWIYDNIPTMVTVLYTTDTGPKDYQLPAPVQITFTVGAAPAAFPFELPEAGTITGVRFNYLKDTSGHSGSDAIAVNITDDQAQKLAQGQIAADMSGGGPKGTAYTATVPAIPVEAKHPYILNAQLLAGGPVAASTSVVAIDSEWDENIPLRLDGRDGFAQYKGVNLSLQDPDSPAKREHIVSLLEQADYLVMSSQRRVWSETRLPQSYPMTYAFYQMLFGGQLGYEQVDGSSYNSVPNLGPLYISDIGAGLGWGAPPKLGMLQPFFGSEEAFSVYDHAPIWIWHKTPAYTAAQAQAALSAIDLTHIVHYDTVAEASQVHPSLLLTPQDATLQQAGGTWSRMFDPNNLLNRFQPLTVIIWWLMVSLLGLAAFPLLFMALPGLADRGYAFSKTLALLLLAFLAWLGASSSVVPFTWAGVALMAALLLVIGGLAARRRWADLRAFWQARRSYILFVEGWTLALFLLFVLIRIGNPDLWHPVFGGEKPMDFAYLNAVIKSTVFPPYDPWFAGGYINYYYFGFVIVASPIKLLSIVPSIAYNLALPTLFALTGIGAFGVAYSLASGLFGTLLAVEEAAESTPTEGTPEVEGSQGPEESESVQEPEAVQGVLVAEEDQEAPAVEGVDRSEETMILTSPAARRARPDWLGFPLVAGILATVFVVLVGNLGELALLVTTLQKVSPVGPDFHSTIPGFEALVRSLTGLVQWVQSGQPLPVGTGSWYWDPTRVIPPGEGEPGPITEFPFFTFLYADLHAHMIAMPLTLLTLGLALGWAKSYGASLLTYRLPKIGSASMMGMVRAIAGLVIQPIVLTFGLLSLALGVLYPANTWDYFTYLVIVVGALLLAEYERAGRRVTTRGVLRGIAWVAGLVLVSRALFQPYFANFATAYSSVELWQGSKTPLWAYLTILALPLFILTSWMIAEVIGWHSHLGKKGRAQLRQDFPMLLLAAGLVMLIALFMAVSGYPVTIVALPLITLAVILMLRPGIEPERRAIAGLAAFSLALTMMVEIVVLKGDIGRMNTVFKFYLPVWILFGVISGVAVVWLYQNSRRWIPNLRQVWIGGISLLITACALYPIMAGHAKIIDRFSEQDQPHTLDGMAYMPEAVYGDKGVSFSLEDDYQAIRWMQDNIQGSPVVLEAQSPDLYHWTGRVSIYTGLPSVIGWGWHQIQQRSVFPGGVIEQRGQDVDTLYTTRDTGLALTMLDRYHVSYIYVGTLEHIFYGSSGGLAKFDQLAAQGKLQVVYDRQSDPSKDYTRVTIYRVVPGATNVQGD